MTVRCKHYGGTRKGLGGRSGASGVGRSQPSVIFVGFLWEPPPDHGGLANTKLPHNLKEDKKLNSDSSPDP